jgi:ABC-type proline/glycine betaine transport system ATPase subunit
MVTHDQNNLKYADKIVHIKDGKIFKVEVIRKKHSKPSEENQEGKKMVKSKEINVPMDLKLLMNSFKDLSNKDVNNLLIPFKVKQVFSHLMLPITNYQVEITQKLMRNFFLGKIKKTDFLKKLDKPIEEGGAGWDKRNAENFVDEVAKFYQQAEKIDYSEPFKSAIRLSNFFSDKYPLKKSEFALNIFKESIERRLKNEISREDLKEILDKNSDEMGVGLNKKTAQNIARELELIILIRYLG